MQKSSFELTIIIREMRQGKQWNNNIFKKVFIDKGIMGVRK